MFLLTLKTFWLVCRTADNIIKIHLSSPITMKLLEARLLSLES